MVLAANCIKMYGLWFAADFATTLLHAQLQANMAPEDSVQPLSLVYALKVCFDFRTY